jgi:hypothetical protein
LYPIFAILDAIDIVEDYAFDVAVCLDIVAEWHVIGAESVWIKELALGHAFCCFLFVDGILLCLLLRVVFP